MAEKASTTNWNILPEPPCLGLPDRFPAWRNRQDQAVLRAVESSKRFVALVCPTGFGKSLAYVATSLLSGQRTAVLTSTKGLQQQILSDFGSVGLVDIRGQNNYPCVIDNRQEAIPRDLPRCDEGPCHAGIKCDLMKAGCLYYDAVKRAKASSLVVTNYSYWMSQKEFSDGLGKFGLLVLDECHSALDQLAEHLGVELYAHEFNLIGGDTWFLPEDASFENWKEAANAWWLQCQDRIDDLGQRVRSCLEPSRRSLREIKVLKKLAQKLSRLATAQGEWVHEIRRQGPQAVKVARFDPVWPGSYSERHLFQGIPKVILTSATIRPKTLSLLGVGSSEVDFAEYPSSFPVSRRPIYWVPTVRMDKRADREDVNTWMSKIDAVIGARLDRKGLVHAVSYDRANLIARRSQWSEFMVLHDSATAAMTIDRFKRMRPPAVLVSPSVSTGFDFPMDEARYQIVAKLPFPDARDLVLAARTKKDKNYALYITAQILVQMCGRTVRSESDQAETFILDDHFSWMFNRHKDLFPKWFLEAVSKQRTIPRPLVLD